MIQFIQHWLLLMNTALILMGLSVVLHVMNSHTGLKNCINFHTILFISRLCKWLCNNVALAAPTILFKGGGKKEDYIIVQLYIS